MKYYILVFILSMHSSFLTKTECTQIATEANLIDTVLKQLGKERSQIYERLIVTKVRPNNKGETIVVIPEIVSKEADGCCLTLNSYILIVDSATGIIKNQYFESSKTNNWISDAVVLSEITIDTARYTITDTNRAFGIRVFYYGSSKPNPYSSTTLSLYIKSRDGLKKVLKDYEVQSHSGEWDTTCYGEFIDIKTTLSISSNKSNGFYDLITSSIITETKNNIDSNGECQDKKEVTKLETTLTYNGKVYREYNLK